MMREPSVSQSKSATCTGRRHQSLLRYSRVEDTDHLGTRCACLANAAKAEQQTVLSQEFTNVCLARGLAPELYAPVVSTAIKTGGEVLLLQAAVPMNLRGGVAPS
jgi:hypothetical protein